MQGIFCARRCNHYLQSRTLFSKVIPTRQFASRSTPAFDSFKSSKSSGSAKSSAAKSPGFDSERPSTSPRKARQYESAKQANANAEAASLARSWFTPRKLVFFSLAGLIGYEVYVWQKDPARSTILNPRFFTPFILETREKVSSTSAILNLLSLPRGQNTKNVSEAWERGVWSVQVMQPELQIARSYTPLPPLEDTEPEQIRLLVRQEPQGEVSTFLHTIYRGTLVHLRGPKVEYEIPENVDEILFLAGGTGIAPALQVAHTLFNHRKKATEDGPELRILWANRRREDSINGLDSPTDQQAQDGSAQDTTKLAPKPSHSCLVQEVESLKAKHRGKIIVDYLVDEQGSYITESLLRTYLSDVDQTSNQDGTPRTKIVLVSGPEGFVDVFAGPKAWHRGNEIQGPLGGILKRIDPQGWQIWKL